MSKYVQAAVTKTIDWVAYKQQKVISHSSGGWNLRSVASMVRFSWEPSLEFQTVDLRCSHYRQKRAQALLWLIKALIPLTRALPWFSSVQFSHSVMSDSLWLHGLQHNRPPCPSPIPRVYSNSCALSQWCHPTISSSVVPFTFHLQAFPVSGSFPMSQFFASGGQSMGASPSVLPRNIQDRFPLRWTGWISLQSKGLPRVFSNTTVQKHQFFGAQLSLWSNSDIHTWPLEKP